jgi:hypothetical protein
MPGKRRAGIGRAGQAADRGGQRSAGAADCRVAKADSGVGASSGPASAELDVFAAALRNIEGSRPNSGWSRSKSATFTRWIFRSGKFSRRLVTAVNAPASGCRRCPPRLSRRSLSAEDARGSCALVLATFRKVADTCNFRPSRSFELGPSRNHIREALVSGVSAWIRSCNSLPAIPQLRHISKLVANLLAVDQSNNSK